MTLSRKNMEPHGHAHHDAGNVNRRAGLGCVLALLVLGGCAGTRSGGELQDAVDKVGVLSSKRGAEAFSQGLYEQAIDAYTLALNRARMMDRAGDSASAAYNLAACYAAKQDFDLARDFLLEARANFERMHASGGVGETWLLEAKMLQAEKKYALSSAACDQALAQFSQHGESPRMAAHAYVLKAYLACERGELVEADTALKEARRAHAQQQNSLLQAEFLSTEGYVLTAGGHSGRAALKYDDAAVAYRHLQRARDMSEMLSQAGMSYQRDGQHAKAGECFYRAARSDYAQGRVTLALTRLDMAFAAAKTADDGDLTDKCSALFRTIRSQVDSAGLKGEDRHRAE